jgi:phage gpG-like protein
MVKVDFSAFNRKVDAIMREYKAIPPQVGYIASVFFKERFDEGAWLDTTKEAWKPRKRRRPGGIKRRQKLLVDTGRLKRSIRKISATPTQVVVGTDIPYASIHNEGGTINKNVLVKTHTRKASTRTRNGRRYNIAEHTVKAHQRRMNTTIPKRQFIGNSYTLERRIYLFIASRMMKVLKQD